VVAFGVELLRVEKPHYNQTNRQPYQHHPEGALEERTKSRLAAALSAGTRLHRLDLLLSGLLNSAAGWMGSHAADRDLCSRLLTVGSGERIPARGSAGQHKHALLAGSINSP